MNIFGHAWVATQRDPSVGFVLGALLPDIEQMVGGRIEAVGDAEVQRGVQFHLRTDAVFHDSRSFVDLSTAGRRWLANAGVRRGPTLAAAHVGVEMLIDGFIVDPRSRRLFRDALEYPVDLTWRDASHQGRFAFVRSRLGQANIPDAYRNSQEVTNRLELVLRHRPRLRLLEPETEAVGRWLKRIQPEVAEAMPALTRDLLTAA